MAKYCNLCGAPLEDGVKYCKNCGCDVSSYSDSTPAAQIDAPTPYANPYANPYTNPYIGATSGAPASGDNSRKKKQRILLALLAVVVAAALIAVAAFVIFGNSDSSSGNGSDAPYNKAMSTFCSALSGNYEDIMESYPDAVVDSLCDTNGMSRSEFRQWVKEYAQEIEDARTEVYGENCKVSYKILSSTKLGKSRINEIQASFEGVDLTVSEAYEVKTKLTFSGDEEKGVETHTFTALKIDGAWYITICTETDDGISISFI